MAHVTLKSVYKIYPGDKGADVTAVRDFNIEVKDREFVVFVGPSGCGKSTTLRMIAGLEDISSGDVYIGERHVNNVPPKDRDIAMVFQNYALYPHMTVRQNMAFGLKLRKMPRREIDRRVEEASTILGLEQLLERKPKALSGGQRQRVALGRSIVRQPAVFLFDEPLSNLDAKMRVQMRAEIIKLHQSLQATMIYVTHDQVEAMTMGDRIVVMDAVVNPETGLKEGVIQQIDSPLNLYNAPANMFVAGFLGSPPMNLIKGGLTSQVNGLLFSEVDNGPIKFALHDCPAAQAYIGKEVVLGIRPEYCRLISPDQNSPDNAFEAMVEIVERMGADTYYYVQTGRHQLVIRNSSSFLNYRAGKQCTFQVDISCAHIFDPETGLAIPCQPVPTQQAR
jgi:multiple sugar transport system ATP-binding protein